MRFLVAFTLAAFTLASASQDEGWVTLFDGKTFDHWSAPEDSWAIEDGTLSTLPKPKVRRDLISTKVYGDFELEFDWKVSEGGNTGLKYRVQRTVWLDPAVKNFEANVNRELLQPSGARGEEYPIAYEMQLIDDERHADAKKGPDRTTGALYSMIGPEKHLAHPAGQWNQGRLVVRGNHFEHWINGELALSGSLDNPAGLERLKARWKDGTAVYEVLAHAKPTGQITLQHHEDKVWFRNIRIRELK